MTSILASICKIFGNNFKRYYLKNGRLFLDFLFYFWNVHKIWNILKKGWVSQPKYFGNYFFLKRLLLKPLESLAAEHHSVINVLTGSKHRWKLQGNTIILSSQ